MGFKIGLDLPGEAWSAFLNPRSPFAAAAPYLGKMLGGAIDLIGGFPNEELRGSAWEHERAKAAYAKDKGDESVFVDEFGNISETPIPDSNYGGQAGSDLARAGSSRLFQNEMFDTPHLLGIAASAPYLHDGRARTLEELWTTYQTNDLHGVSSYWNKHQLNDLIEYLRTL